ncbi:MULTISPECIES: BTAD domain-containing putative transcriptional regulator [unclassified Rhodococcus (in: high G+C Gram-positive bacteria)]|uniref:BTAD domain-containing putative transcriptional regulator n=1 Tax=unclassified Rhodococcus (in: high G+C Gram-positive bacteria) TaxID=192944 RepID=UPI0016397E60|nr:MULTISPECIES: BTAD domain-containing putative transcriptional regulator [unclassified Rhodococcus (in: high G+C Gram-positive bacteria)]MBC2639381.1 winged helix-turn-helix domain-containing protein [Rhodococcus sp. 3A]MBC2895874.1 winged helix-turn-helix domain-containing protein [Rhodococcus sp. 4CII]
MSVDERVAPASTPIQVALLGEVSTYRSGVLAPLPGTRARSLLVALARDPGRSRAAQALIDEVWGEDPPRSPMNALHTQVSRLRAALPDGVLEIGPAGYRLRVPRDAVDLTRAEDMARRWQGRDHDRGVGPDEIRAALALWRGEPGADLPAGVAATELAAHAAVIRGRLEAAELAALVEAGAWEAALPEAQVQVAAGPLDERAHADLMRALAGLGRENEALDVFATFRTRLVDRLGADPSPALVALHTEILRGGSPPASAVQRLAPPDRTAIGLRAAPNTLLGRDTDIVAIERLLTSSRVVTILGPGGAGKTRLAHELGVRAAAGTSVALVELAALRSSEDVVAAISGTLGLSEVDLAPGRLVVSRVHSARERLREALSAGPMLLILDNCEHVIGACSEIVADLVAAGNQLTVLATSRSPLMLASEAVYPLPPLASDAEDAPAVQLFTARARAVRPTARLDPETVRGICRTLDGLPLAIELAAARVRSMSVEDIGRRLEHRFALLRSNDPTSPERHRTLHAVIDWSWQLLGEQQQVALRRLCRFPAGFTLDAARTIAEWDGVDDVVDAVEGLVNQSLLSVSETSDTLRYYMLETVREYGEEQLAAAAEESEVFRRQGMWARGFASEALGRCRADQVALADDIDADHDNLLAVLRWAVERGDAETVTTVFPLLGGLWSIRGAHSEVMNWTPRILAATADSDLRDVDSELVAYTFLLAGMHLVFGGETRSLARTRTRLRHVVRERPDLPSVTGFAVRLILSLGSGRRLARAVADGVRSNDRETRAAALSVRASLRENLGDFRGAMRDARAVSDLCVAIGDVWGTAMAAQFLGSLHSQSGQYRAAVGRYQVAVEGMRRLGAQEEANQLWGFQASALIADGDVVRGRKVLAETVLEHRGALAATDDHQQDEWRVAAISSLAEADLADGDVERGLARYREALDMMYPRIVSEPYADPFGLMLAASVVCAHVLHGRSEMMVEFVPQLAGWASTRLGMGMYPDLPVTGAVAAGVGCFEIAHGNSERGLALLALSSPARARQDSASLQHHRHVAFALDRVDADRWESARARVGTWSRRMVRAEILDMLTTLR